MTSTKNDREDRLFSFQEMYELEKHQYRCSICKQPVDVCRCLEFKAMIDEIT